MLGSLWFERNVDSHLLPLLQIDTCVRGAGNRDFSAEPQANTAPPSFHLSGMGKHIVPPDRFLAENKTRPRNHKTGLQTLRLEMPQEETRQRPAGPV